MKLSTRTRYGTRALVELAGAWESGEPLSVATLAEHQELSAKYLEQLMARLKRAGLVASVPGTGYRLAEAPKRIRLDRVFRALEGTASLLPCLDAADTCDRAEACPTRPLWQEMTSALHDRLSRITLQEMLPESDGRPSRRRRRPAAHNPMEESP